MTTPVSCNLLSGAGFRLFIQPADCTKAPWSSSSTFSADFTGVDSDSAYFLGNFSGVPDLRVGFANQEVYVAAGEGFSSTIKGASSGSGTFNIVMDKDSPIAGASAGALGSVRSGTLYDFVITADFSDPTGTDGTGQIIGRFRAGQFSLPLQLSGEPVTLSIPVNFHGRVYGDILGLPVA